MDLKLGFCVFKLFLIHIYMLILYIQAHKNLLNLFKMKNKETGCFLLLILFKPTHLDIKL